MQIPSYISGFIYSIKTHKILLIQSDQAWSTFGGECSEGEEAQVAFRRIASEKLNLDLKAKNIYPIYDYFHSKMNKNNFVFYGEIKKHQNFACLKEGTYCWVAFNEISKLMFANTSKQDVIVGERVISARWRDSVLTHSTTAQGQY